MREEVPVDPGRGVPRGDAPAELPDGPAVWVALGEDALYCSNGGPDVLRRQLEHLRDVTAMPNVRFRVLLRSAKSGIVPALSAPFTLLQMEQGKAIAYVESLTRPDYIRATAPYVSAFEQAWNLAASEEESAVILGHRITNRDDS